MRNYVYVATNPGRLPEATYRKAYLDAMTDVCCCIFTDEYLEYEKQMITKIKERDVKWVANNTVFEGQKLEMMCARCHAVNLLWNKLKEKEKEDDTDNNKRRNQHNPSCSTREPYH